MTFQNLDWEALPSKTVRTLMAGPLGMIDAAIAPAAGVKFEGYVAKLSFYKSLQILRLVKTDTTNTPISPAIYALWSGGQQLFVLDGESGPVHAANAVEKLQLTYETVEDYFRFFMFAVRGPDGPFILFETAPEGASAQSVASRFARPLELLPEGDNRDEGRRLDHDKIGDFEFKAVILYGTLLAEAQFAVARGGEVQMTDDEPLDAEIAPEDIPAVPSLAAGANPQAWSGARVPAVNSPAPPSSRSTLFILVELLLEKALAAQSRNRLIESFNASLAPSSALDQFASLVFKEFPVVVIESGMAFVEETVAEILHAHATPPVNMARYGGAQVLDDVQIKFDLPNKGPALILVPLQVYKTIVNVDRFAYDLATKEFTALIACDNTDRLPESLRRLKDVTLRFPSVDAAMFEVLFQRVMGCALPANWAADGAQWVGYVLHTDFAHPRRMRLTADQALDYIRHEVTDRLSAVRPEQGFGLQELNGLGEARRFAEDLIADIHGAIKGDIPWSQVDRGVLLVGAPGTGKTTLAKAIAKDCGVRFIAASATEWQSGGDLGNHIRAIRRTFAEARNYAPSILFIDEIDALGNRETFTGQNAQYSTQVVDAVLEQLQGIDPNAPVFVLAATNFEDRVDPALKRSGRLDCIIRVPRPNSAALSLIYDYYLGEIAKNVTIDPSTDTKTLGRLSLGLTGADVEKIVRGAARRARKGKRVVGQGDLIAELTNKPRGVDDYLKMSPEEIERTAVHESGHALAMYLGASKGAEIGFVTVVPRSDGSLGFVAFMPDERQSLTRRDYMQKLEINLAGRAAEEVKYGTDGVSGGASSDLQTAMALATLMVTRFGLGGDNDLTWSADVSPKHTRQAEKILAEAYGETKKNLQQNETKLMRLAAELVMRQELFGSDVQAILSARASHAEPFPPALASAKDG